MVQMLTLTGVESRGALGLLGEFLFVPSIIQPLRWSPNAWTMRKCLQQWLLWDSSDHGLIIPVDEEPVYKEEEYYDYDNEEEDDDDDDDDDEGDELEEATKILLTIVPSIEPYLLSGFGIEPSARKIPGVYEYPPAYHTTVVVTSELPRDPSTLSLRLLGRGPTQRAAIEDWMALPTHHPLRRLGLKPLQDWYQLLLKGEMGQESAALMQSLSQVMEP
jgi:hypothetical protein